MLLLAGLRALELSCSGLEVVQPCESPFDDATELLVSLLTDLSADFVSPATVATLSVPGAVVFGRALGGVAGPREARLGLPKLEGTLAAGTTFPVGCNFFRGDNPGRWCGSEG